MHRTPVAAAPMLSGPAPTEQRQSQAGAEQSGGLVLAGRQAALIPQFRYCCYGTASVCVLRRVFPPCFHKLVWTEGRLSPCPGCSPHSPGL